MVVAAILMASTLSFVEHACHMDISRLLALICCCDPVQSNPVTHTDMYHGESQHDGMHDHDMIHAEHESETSLPFSEGDEPMHQDASGFADQCCSSSFQTYTSSVLVRHIKNVDELAIFVVWKAVVFLIDKPPIVFEEQPPPIPRYISILPGYILFSAFLN